MLTIPAILEALEQLTAELATEVRLVRVGLKDEQRLAPILARHVWLGARETVEFVRRERDAARDADHRERRDRLYHAVVRLYRDQQLAPQVDALETALTQKQVAGQPYYSLQAHLQNEPEFARREHLGGLVDGVQAEFTPAKREILRRELEILQVDLGQPAYREYCRQKKQFKYAALEPVVRESLARTAPIYQRHMAAWTEQKLGRSFGGLSRYHVNHLLRLAEHDAHFPQAEMVARLMSALRHLGIDFNQLPQIRLDLDNRPRKHPRAFCTAPRIPAEVWLVLKPAGGLTDYETFLHEAGHALHFGLSRADLPYEYRHLARSYALSEIYSFLLQNLVQDPGWLRAVGRVDESTGRRIRYHKILSDLYLYRRYSAKFLAETEFFAQADLGNGEIYARALGAATGFGYRPTSYLFDLDGEFYSADYLRAWLGEAQVQEYLRQHHGPSWWASAAVGRLLADWWAQAGQPDAETMVAALGLTPLEPAALERRFAELDALG